MQGHKITRKRKTDTHTHTLTAIIIHPWVHFMGWNRRKYEGFIALKFNDSPFPPPIQVACFSVYVKASSVYPGNLSYRAR